ncbi:MAG TPA: extracellular solute-binding protein [Stellaceae bacterium]|nr:extracellular solute-binding protein [Stellaceae bacterium]
MPCRTTGLRESALSLLVLLILVPLSAARAETIDQLYEKAKLEKALVIYTGAGPAGAKAAADAFEKRFPGIAVTPHGGFSNVLDNEIDQQLKDNKVTADFVQFQTIQDYHRWDKAGALMHFKPEGFDQVLDAMKDKNGAWVAVNAIPMLYGYNPDKVQEADVPKSALDFLKPQFRGKIVTVYPTDDDATLYNFDLIVRKYGWDYMKKYMANEPYFIQGHRDVAARVKSGTDFVSFDITNGSQTSGPGPGGNLKIAMPAKDKTPVFFTAGGILKNAPHPNAAKLFLSWSLSKEQQSRVPILYSSRKDVPPPAGLPPLTSPRFANGYRDFLGDGTRPASLRKRFEALIGPVTNKATVQ